jgi:hypothetical protein
MTPRMLWQTPILVLTAATACGAPNTSSTPKPEPAAPGAAAVVDVIIVDDDGKTTKTTMAAPTIVLSRSQLEAAPLIERLNEEGALGDAPEHYPRPVHGVDLTSFVNVPCMPATCLSPPPPPPPRGLQAYIILAPGGLQDALGLRWKDSPLPEPEGSVQP